MRDRVPPRNLTPKTVDFQNDIVPLGIKMPYRDNQFGFFGAITTTSEKVSHKLKNAFNDCKRRTTNGT